MVLTKRNKTHQRRTKMTKKEMIDEMAKCLQDPVCMSKLQAKTASIMLYGKGYRKIPEDAVVLTERQHEVVMRNQYDVGFNFGYKKGSKETAEKIMQDLKPLLEGFVHTDTGENLYVYKCKQIGVEIKE